MSPRAAARLLLRTRTQGFTDLTQAGALDPDLRLLSGPSVFPPSLFLSHPRGYDSPCPSPALTSALGCQMSSAHQASGAFYSLR